MWHSQQSLLRAAEGKTNPTARYMVMSGWSTSSASFVTVITFGTIYLSLYSTSPNPGTARLSVPATAL